ncbi:MAG: PilZ domain-containing protein [Planctomycetes bacterium]|nr:PilZ domain-containing protein [Planctomycetota bacterium]
MTRDLERRRYYRIQYPLAERPRLIVNHREFRVVEISEGGAQIKNACSAPKCLATPYPVRIIFQKGEEACTDAVIVRESPGQFILRFVKEISLRMLTSEQIRLAKRYPERRKSLSRPTSP